MKYVLFELPDALQTVRIFDDITNHCEVVNEVLTSSPGLRVVSAGRVSFSGSGKVVCTNGSVSLGKSYNVDQSKSDENEIERFIRLF